MRFPKNRAYPISSIWFSDFPWNQPSSYSFSIWFGDQRWNRPLEAPSTQKLIFQNGAFSIPHPEKAGSSRRGYPDSYGKWWENDEKMMIDQWKPKESNGIQCDLGWFEELPLFSETSMMDHLNGERWSIGQVPVESQKMSDTVMHFLNWRCFRRSRFQIFFATPNSYYHHGYHHFLHTFPHIFGSPEKKQKRLLRVAPTARYSVVDLEVYCTCCTPDVSLFFVFFILFPFISYVPCAAESIVHLDESPVELKNIQGYFAAEHSLSLGVWTSQLAWWTNRMEMWVKTARFWGLSKCHVQTRWITYLIYVKSSQKRPSSGVTCRPTRAKNLRLGHRKADFLL